MFEQRQAVDVQLLQEVEGAVGHGLPTGGCHGDERPHAIVIGSGFGGLAAAIRLGARGYRVTVLERRDQAGGRAYVYRQDGFTFDGGPTVITAPFLFEELWALCGRRLSDDVDLRPVSPFYRIRFHDGQVFDYTGSAEAMRSEIARFEPSDVDGYERLMDMSRKIFEVGFERLSYSPFSSWTDMAKIVPDMIKLQSYRSVWSLVAKYVKNDRLRQAQVARRVPAASVVPVALSYAFAGTAAPVRSPRRAVRRARARARPAT